MKRKGKYEIFILEAHEAYIDARCDEMQGEGWEIAGDINIHRAKTPDANFVSIPMKRIVDKEIYDNLEL